MDLDQAIPRRVRQLNVEKRRSERSGPYLTLGETRPLEATRDDHSYVLLAEPGMGKTTAMKMEARAAGTTCMRVADFLYGSLPSPPSLPIFLDALDEAPGTDAIGRLRVRLSELAWPRVRIACRASEWHDAAGDWADTVSVYSLAPLSEDEARQLLGEGADEIVSTLRRMGLGSLLESPLLVDWARSVRGDLASITSKRSFYERASRELATETNGAKVEQRRGANRAPSAEAVLDAASACFATYLLAGDARLSITLAYGVNDVDVRDFLESGLVAIESGHIDDFGDSLSARPAHRTIAEFLAAQALVRRLEGANAESARSVAALVTRDGGIPTSLRGLAGWMACLSEPLFRALLDVDPVPLALGGDVTTLSDAQRQALLEELAMAVARPESPLSWAAVDDPCWITLLSNVTPEYVRAAAPLLQVAFLSAMEQCEQPPSWTVEVCDELRRHAKSSATRRAAAGTWLTCARPSNDALKAALEEEMSTASAREATHAAVVLGLEWANRGLPLLDVLHLIDASLVTIERRRLVERIEHAPVSEAPALLRAVAAMRAQGSRRGIELDRLTDALALRVLTELGSATPAAEVLAMLRGTVEQWDGRERDVAAKMRAWLVASPAVATDLLREIHDRAQAAVSAEKPLAWWPEYHEDMSVLGLDPMRGLAGHPVLEAIAIAEASRLDTEGAEPLVEHVLAQVPDAEQQHWMTTHPRFAAWRAARHATFATENQAWASRREARDAEVRRKREHDAEKLLAAMETSPAPWRALAFALDQIFDADEDTYDPSRAPDAWGTYAPRIVAHVERELRQVPSRVDIPSVEEQLLALADGKAFDAARVLPRALSLAHASDAQLLGSLLDTVLSTATVATLCTQLSAPAWLLELAERMPDVVASAWCAYAPVALRTKLRTWFLAALARRGAAARPALDRCVFPTLTLLPAKLSAEHTELLRECITLAFAADPVRLAELAATPRRYESEVVRAYWMGAALACAGLHRDDGELQRAATFFSDARRGQARVQHLFQLLDDHPIDPSWRVRDWSPEALEQLISVAATNLAPGARGPRFLFETFDAFDLRWQNIRSFVELLASREDGGDALDRLIANPRMQPFARTLRWHREAQRRNAIDSATPDRDQLLRRLANRVPHSPAALHALVVETLERYQVQLAASNTIEANIYWNSPGVVHDENYCRDRVLDHLIATLISKGVTRVDREQSAPKNKRADFEVTRPPWRIAGEVKLTKNPDVWTAWHGQLPQYTSLAHTAGYGVYLVIWHDQPRKAPDGTRVGSAAAMQQKLRAMIAAAGMAAKTGVVVLDVRAGATSST